MQRDLFGWRRLFLRRRPRHYPAHNEIVRPFQPAQQGRRPKLIRFLTNITFC